MRRLMSSRVESPHMRSIVHRVALVNGALSAVLAPFPLVDELLLVHSLGLLSLRIGRAQGLRASEVPWRPIGITIGKGLFARGVINLSVAFLPGIDAVVNATTAV